MEFALQGASFPCRDVCAPYTARVSATTHYRRSRAGARAPGAAANLPRNCIRIARMRELKRTALLAQSPARLFALISDVERYPEFVPGCTRARIESRSDNEIVAT